MRSQKAVLDWINTSTALSFNKEDKTGEPEMRLRMTLQSALATRTAKQWKITTMTFQSIFFQKFVEAITF